MTEPTIFDIISHPSFASLDTDKKLKVVDNFYAEIATPDVPDSDRSDLTKSRDFAKAEIRKESFAKSIADQLPEDQRTPENLSYLQNYVGDYYNRTKGLTDKEASVVAPPKIGSIDQAAIDNYLTSGSPAHLLPSEVQKIKEQYDGHDEPEWNAGDAGNRVTSAMIQVNKDNPDFLRKFLPSNPSRERDPQFEKQFSEAFSQLNGFSDDERLRMKEKWAVQSDAHGSLYSYRQSPGQVDGKTWELQPRIGGPSEKPWIVKSETSIDPSTKEGRKSLQDLLYPVLREHIESFDSGDNASNMTNRERIESVVGDDIGFFHEIGRGIYNGFNDFGNHAASAIYGLAATADRAIAYKTGGKPIEAIQSLDDAMQRYAVDRSTAYHIPLQRQVDGKGLSLDFQSAGSLLGKTAEAIENLGGFAVNPIAGTLSMFGEAKSNAYVNYYNDLKDQGKDDNEAHRIAANSSDVLAGVITGIQASTGKLVTNNSFGSTAIRNYIGKTVGKALGDGALDGAIVRKFTNFAAALPGDLVAMKSASISSRIASGIVHDLATGKDPELQPVYDAFKKDGVISGFEEFADLKLVDDGLVPVVAAAIFGNMHPRGVNNLDLHPGFVTADRVYLNPKSGEYVYNLPQGKVKFGSLDEANSFASSISKLSEAHSQLTEPTTDSSGNVTGWKFKDSVDVKARAEYTDALNKKMEEVNSKLNSQTFDPTAPHTTLGTFNSPEAAADAAKRFAVTMATKGATNEERRANLLNDLTDHFASIAKDYEKEKQDWIKARTYTPDRLPELEAAAQAINQYTPGTEEHRNAVKEHADLFNELYNAKSPQRKLIEEGANNYVEALKASARINARSQAESALQAFLTSGGKPVGNPVDYVSVPELPGQVGVNSYIKDRLSVTSREHENGTTVWDVGVNNSALPQEAPAPQYKIGSDFAGNMLRDFQNSKQSQLTEAKGEVKGETQKFDDESYNKWLEQKAQEQADLVSKQLGVNPDSIIASNLKKAHLTIGEQLRGLIAPPAKSAEASAKIIDPSNGPTFYQNRNIAKGKVRQTPWNQGPQSDRIETHASAPGASDLVESIKNGTVELKDISKADIIRSIDEATKAIGEAPDTEKPILHAMIDHLSSLMGGAKDEGPTEIAAQKSAKDEINEISKKIDDLHDPSDPTLSKSPDKADIRNALIKKKLNLLSPQSTESNVDNIKNNLQKEHSISEENAKKAIDSVDADKVAKDVEKSVNQKARRTRVKKTVKENPSDKSVEVESSGKKTIIEQKPSGFFVGDEHVGHSIDEAVGNVIGGADKVAASLSSESPRVTAVSEPGSTSEGSEGKDTVGATEGNTAVTTESDLMKEAKAIQASVNKKVPVIGQWNKSRPFSEAELLKLADEFGSKIRGAEKTSDFLNRFSKDFARKHGVDKSLESEALAKKGKDIIKNQVIYPDEHGVSLHDTDDGLEFRQSTEDREPTPEELAQTEDELRGNIGSYAKLNLSGRRNRGGFVNAMVVRDAAKMAIDFIKKGAGGLVEFLKAGMAKFGGFFSQLKDIWESTSKAFAGRASEVAATMPKSESKLPDYSTFPPALRSFMENSVPTTPEQIARRNSAIEHDRIMDRTFGARDPAIIEHLLKSNQTILGHGPDMVSDAIRPLHKILSDIHPELGRMVLNSESFKGQLYNDWAQRVKPFYDGLSKLSSNDRLEFMTASRAASMGDETPLNVFKATHPEIASHMNDWVLHAAEIRKIAIDNGVDLGHIDNYFPQLVKDYQKFKEYLGGTNRNGDIIKAIQQAERNSPTGSLTEDERADIANKVVSAKTNNNSRGLSGSTRSRVVENFTSEEAKFYMDPHESLRTYLQRMSHDITSKRYYGSDVRSTTDGGVFPEEVGEDGVVNLPKSSTFGATLLRLRESGDITARQSEEAIAHLRSLKMMQPDPGLLKFLKTFNTPLALINPFTYPKIFSEMVNAVYANGMMNSIGGFARAIKVNTWGLKSDTAIHLGEVGAARDSELVAGGYLKRFGDFAFKYGGRGYIHNVIGDTALNGFMIKLQRMSPEERLSQLKPYENFLQDSPEMLSEKIGRGDFKSPDAKYVGFSALSQIRPTSIASMPPLYIRSQGLRLLYNLKMYQAHNLDFMRGQIIDQFMNGDKSKALAAFATLGMATVIAGATADQAVDYILGRPVPFKGAVLDNTLKLFMASRYQTDALAKMDFNTLRNSVISTPLTSFLQNSGQLLSKIHGDHALGDNSHILSDVVNSPLMNQLPGGVFAYYRSHYSPKAPENNLKLIHDNASDSVKSLKEEYATLASIGNERRRELQKDTRFNQLKYFHQVNQHADSLILHHLQNNDTTSAIDVHRIVEQVADNPSLWLKTSNQLWSEVNALGAKPKRFK